MKKKNETDKPIKKPETGGAPPTVPIQPNPVNDNKPSFSYSQLSFIDSFYVDGRMMLTFLVLCKTPYFIDVTQSDYLDYITTYFRLMEGKDKDTQCTCDVCNPTDFTLFEDDKISIEFKSEESTKEEQLPVYFVAGLTEGLTVGVCDVHKKDRV